MPFNRVAFLPHHPSIPLYDAMRHSRLVGDLNTVLLASRGMQWALASACDAAPEEPLVAISWLRIHNWLNGFAFGLATGSREQAVAADMIERSQATPDQMACIAAMFTRLGSHE